MYVPAYYYIQSHTTYQADNQESIIITQEYAPHSQILDLIFEGLESEVMTDDKAHKYDAKLMKYLKSVF